MRRRKEHSGFNYKNKKAECCWNQNEKKIKEHIEREAQLEIKEIEVAELKQELEKKLAELSVKVDKRKKEFKEN